MSNNSFALSRFDFESGRFTKVCRFITRNWPWDNPPSLSGAQEILAKYLGYDNFHDAQNSATVRSGGESNAFFSGSMTAIPDGDKYGWQAYEFIRSWPIDTLGRWNDNLEACTFDSEYLIYAAQEFDNCWPSEAAVHIGRALRTASATIDVRNASLRDVLGDDLIEALLKATVLKTFSELFSVNRKQCIALSKASGIGLSDISNLPRNEAFFPNLYQYLRAHVQTKLASQNIYDILTRQRNDHGFYLTSGKVPDTLLYGGKNELYSIPMEDGTLHIFIRNDDIEDSPFKSYTWQANLISPSGDRLLNAVGSYISGPARESYSSGQFILDLDQVGEADAQIMNALFEKFIAYENSITRQEDHDKLTTQTINTLVYFHDGNIVTLHRVERSETSRSGIGAECLLEIFTILKRKFRRNMHFVCIVDPFQFTEQSNFSEDIVKERKACEIALSGHLLRTAYNHENIKTAETLLASEIDNLSGDELLAEYCGKMFLSE